MTHKNVELDTKEEFLRKSLGFVNIINEHLNSLTISSLSAELIKTTKFNVKVLNMPIEYSTKKQFHIVSKKVDVCYTKYKAHVEEHNNLTPEQILAKENKYKFDKMVDEINQANICIKNIWKVDGKGEALDSACFYEHRFSEKYPATYLDKENLEIKIDKLKSFTLFGISE
jgi:hypothetical protein